MRALVASTLGTFLLLSGCEPPATSPGPDGGIVLEIASSHGGSIDPDAGMIRIRGTVNRDVPLAPGEERFVDVPPGSYTVALEALTGGEVVAFGQRSGINVQEGQVTTVSITPSNFIPSLTQVPATAEVGTPFTVRWSSVAGADDYELDLHSDPNFGPGTDSHTLASTSASVIIGSEGPVYFRVRAVNEYGSEGHPSGVSNGTQVISGATGTAPVITDLHLGYLPVVGCPTGAMDFGTAEIVEYQDEDGDVPEGVLGPSNVESQYRFADAEDWQSFHDVQGEWEPLDGSEGSEGILVESTCWDTNDDREHLDVRVRIRDAQDLWSEWAETRLPFPDTLEVTPAGGDAGVLIDGGSSVQFTAVASHDGVPLPGDPVMWSNYNGADVASIDQDGRYTFSSSEEGLDQVYARAVFSYTHVGIQGPGAGENETWWAPCWTNPSVSGTSGNWQDFRMLVYEGTEYQIRLLANDTSTTGDPDLYLGFGFFPDTDDHTESSATAGIADETILWTAPSDGYVWISTLAATDYSGYAFNVRTGDSLCGAPGGTEFPPSPAAAPKGSRAAAPQPGEAARMRADRRSPGARPSLAMERPHPRAPLSAGAIDGTDGINWTAWIEEIREFHDTAGIVPVYRIDRTPSMLGPHHGPVTRPGGEPAGGRTGPDVRPVVTVEPPAGHR